MVMALRSTAFLPITTAKSAIVDRKSDLLPGGRGGGAVGFDLRSSPLLTSVSTSTSRSSRCVLALALDASAGDGISKKVSAGSGSLPNTNYVVPLDKAPSSSCITRPLAEILRDLNKRIPDNIRKPDSVFIPWYHANRMLSFYAPGWCGEIRDVIFSDNGSVTVVYRVTIRGSDGEAYRESTGTISSNDGHMDDPVAAAEQIAFVRACARFGLGLYLYHEE